MGTVYLSFSAPPVAEPPVPGYLYDDHAESLFLQHRWRLNSIFDAAGDTEESIGTVVPPTYLVRGQSGGVLTRVAGITKQTADSLGQHYTSGTTSAVKFWAAPFGGVPDMFTMGMWYSPLESGQANLFCAGASPTYTGNYHGMTVTVISGRLQVQFGDGTGSGSSDRVSYKTPASVVPTTGPAFIVVRATKTTVAADILFDLYVNGIQVACPYESGYASSVMWGDRFTFGTGWWGTGGLYRPIDEPFMTSGYIDDADILLLYQYGVTP